MAASRSDFVQPIAETYSAPQASSGLLQRSSSTSYAPRLAFDDAQNDSPSLQQASLPAAPVAPTGPHALSLKVMRISAPSLATQESTYFEDPEAAQITLAQSMLAFAGLPSSTSVKAPPRGEASLTEASEVARSIAASSAVAEAERAIRQASEASVLSNDQPRISRPVGSVSTLRDWPLSNFLVLPASFGTIYLGETFSAYLCANNETSESVAGARLKVELQIGDPSATDAAPSMRNIKQTLLLADLLYGASGSGEALELLPPSGKLETTVRHEMHELGPHVLICTVSYSMPVGDSWVERSFRKFYKFSVPTSPVAVRTRTYTPRAPNQMNSSLASTRERVLLEVSIENVGGRAIVIDSLQLLPEKGWGWKDISKGEWNDGDDGRNAEHGGAHGDLWRGTSEHLLPTHVRQNLFLLYPLSEDPLRPVPPLPLGIGAHSYGSSSTPQRSGGPSRSVSSATTAAVGSQGRASASPAATVSIPLGRLNIAWRCGLGEQGRLQTSMLARRKQLDPPVACYADQLSTTVPNMQSPQRLYTMRRPTSSRLDGRSASPADAEVVHPPAPSPLLECQVLLHDAPVGFAAHLEEPFSLTYQIWLRDISLLGHLEIGSVRPPIRSRLSISGSMAGKEGARSPSRPHDNVEDGSDSDDDRPLSELASPRLSIGARSFQGGTSSDAQILRTVRKLKVAVQFVALRPTTDFTPVLAYTLPEEELVSTPQLMEPRSGPTTPLREQRIPRTISGSGVAPSIPLAGRPTDPAGRPLSYTVRSSIDGGRGRSPQPPPTTESAPAIRRASLQYTVHTPKSSRPSSPVLSTQTLPALDESGAAATANVSSIKAAEERPTSVSRLNGRTCAPMPFFHPARLSTPGGIAWPSEHVVKLGSSLVEIDPVILHGQPMNADGGALEGEPGRANEATVNLVARYMATEEGVARIGGVRVLLMGWEDEVVESEDRDGPKGAEERAGRKQTVQLETPVLLKELEVVAEMWIHRDSGQDGEEGLL